MLEMPTGKLYVEYTEGAEYTAQVKSIGKDKKNPQVVVLYLSTKLAYEKEQASLESFLCSSYCRPEHEDKNIPRHHLPRHIHSLVSTHWL